MHGWEQAVCPVRSLLTAQRVAAGLQDVHEALGHCLHEVLLHLLGQCPIRFVGSHVSQCTLQGLFLEAEVALERVEGL